MRNPNTLPIITIPTNLTKTTGLTNTTQATNNKIPTILLQPTMQMTTKDNNLGTIPNVKSPQEVSIVMSPE